MKAQQQTDVLRLIDKYLKAGPPEKLVSDNLAAELGVEHIQMVGLLKSLEAAGKIHCKARPLERYTLTAEGSEILDSGSPEYKLAALLPISLEEIKAKPGSERALAHCLKYHWAEKSGNTIVPTKKPEEDVVRVELERIKAGEPAKDLNNLTRRKLVVKESITVFDISPTKEFSTEVLVELTDLTKQLLISGEWRDANFKQYNFNACGIPPVAGSIHPLMKFRSLFRQILQQMGFAEMNTRRWVEGSIWNFDALIQPQTHPCRDSQDTFFIKDRAMPSAEDQIKTWSEEKMARNLGLKDASAACDLLDRSLVESIREAHEFGDGDHLGWRYDWSETEAQTLVLRTHTTAVTARVLRYLALQMPRGSEKTLENWPHKDMNFFSIDRVFRNESLDATHLAEFHQVEGIMCSKTGSLAELMGTIETFFNKIGVRQIKFKPTFNPYTEPSMEIYGWHPTLKKWTEIGNSGIFRPEMLKALGVPKDIIVCGFGLSLERPAMIAHNVKDIRELFGPKAKLSIF